MTLPPFDPEGRGVSILWAGPQGIKTVALTFDDGPVPGKTTEVLDTLAEYKVQASFFVLGEKVERHPDIIRRMVDEGHDIGNHTYSHRNLSKLSPAGVRDEVEKCQEAIQSACGVEPIYFRSPYGAANLTTFSTLSHFGLNAIFWSIDTMDWASSDESAVREAILEGLTGGSIILLHEQSSYSRTLLSTIIDDIRSRGYEFVTLSEMFGFERPLPREPLLVADASTRTEVRPPELPPTVQAVDDVPVRPPTFEDSDDRIDTGGGPADLDELEMEIALAEPSIPVTWIEEPGSEVERKKSQSWEATTESIRPARRPIRTAQNKRRLKPVSSFSGKIDSDPRSGIRRFFHLRN